MYSIIISKDTSGKTFQYRIVKGNEENIIMEGDGYSSSEELMKDLRILCTALVEGLSNVRFG